MLMGNKKCLQLFLLLNILIFSYQIILVLKITASFNKKFPPDCFVNLNVLCITTCYLWDSQVN